MFFKEKPSECQMNTNLLLDYDPINQNPASSLLAGHDPILT